MPGCTLRNQKGWLAESKNTTPESAGNRIFAARCTRGRQRDHLEIKSLYVAWQRRIQANVGLP